MATQALVQQLQRRIEGIETLSRVDDGQTISSGCAAIDHLLPQKGFHRGTLIEWVADLRTKRSSGGCGADYLSMRVAKEACADGGALVVADRNRQFFPPAAAALGIDLGNVVVIRPPENQSAEDRRYDDEFFWAIDQALGCPAVAAVWASVDQVGERWFRRFQLSAENSGTMGLFVRPVSANQLASWSEMRFQVTPHAIGNGVLQHEAAAVQSVRLTLARCRGGRSGQSVNLQIDTVTGGVCGFTSPMLRSGTAS